jgi:outer membrane protein assembly factor BamB
MLTLWGAVACAGDDGASSPLDDTVSAEPPSFLAVDNGRNQLLRIGEDGVVAWAAPLPPGARDLARLGDEVLVSHAGGAVRVRLADGARLDGDLDVDVSGVQSVQALSDAGDLRFAAQDGEVVVVDVDAAGTELRRRTLPGYADLRLMRTLPDGHLLFTATGPDRAVEVDDAGAEVWSAPLPGKGYLATRAEDGTTWATTGDDLHLLQLDASGAVLTALGGDDAGIGLDWFSGFSAIPGSTDWLVANWLGHNAWGTGPHLVRYDAAGEVVWTWADHEAALQITHVLAL